MRSKAEKVVKCVGLITVLFGIVCTYNALRFAIHFMTMNSSYALDVLYSVAFIFISLIWTVCGIGLIGGIDRGTRFFFAAIILTSTFAGFLLAILYDTGLKEFVQHPAVQTLSMFLLLHVWALVLIRMETAASSWRR